MKWNSAAFKKQEGQVLVLSIVFLTLLSSLLVGFFHVSFAVRQKIRLQIAADAAILSALNCEANALNTTALINRAVFANDALSAQLNALVSESSFYRKLAERFSRLLRLIPYAGPVSMLLSKGIQTLETIFKRSASVILPVTKISNKTLLLTQKVVRQVFPYHTIKTAERSLEMNMPQGYLTLLSRATLIRQTRSLQNSLGELGQPDIEKIRKETMDSHTKKRNWKISVAGISPVKKTGGTYLENGELVAWDKMKMRVFSGLRLRWKTVLSSKSRARNLRYSSPKKMVTLLKREHGPILTLGITVQSDFPEMPSSLSFRGRKLTATSAGALIYGRASRPDEFQNTLNPFWRATLIPVASEPTFKKTIPALILKETRH